MPIYSWCICLLCWLNVAYVANVIKLTRTFECSKMLWQILKRLCCTTAFPSLLNFIFFCMCAQTKCTVFHCCHLFYHNRMHLPVVLFSKYYWQYGYWLPLLLNCKWFCPSVMPYYQYCNITINHKYLHTFIATHA